MIDENPIETARRSHRRSEQGCCLLCGRTGVLIELDHTAGRRHDDFLKGPLCSPCHAMVTEYRRRAGADMRYTPDSVERVRRALKATAVFLRLLAEALWRWAESLRGSDSKEV
jgi:hypothetical protein